MKILHIINDLGSGGAEKLLVTGIPYYKKFDVEIELLQLSHKNSIPGYINSLEKEGINVFSLGEENIYNPKLLLKLKKFLKNKKYDLIHVHLFPSMYWAAMLRMEYNVPLVFTEHNTKNRRWGKFYFKFLDKIIYNKYSKIICITDEVKHALLNAVNIDANRVLVINNGISINKIEDAPIIERSNLLSSLGIINDCSNIKIILMTARFDSQKNQKYLLEVFEGLDENIHILFAGEGPLLSDVKELVEGKSYCKRVHFLGFRTDVLSLMKSVDINVLSSYYEGLSGVTLEALASGTPFLGSDVSGINNVVPNKNFVFSQDTNDLRFKINQILVNNNIREQMEKDAKEFVKKFDINIMIQNHMNLYNDLQKK